MSILTSTIGKILRFPVFVSLIFLVALGFTSCGSQERIAEGNSKILISKSDAIQIAREKLRQYEISEISTVVTVHWSNDHNSWIVNFTEDTEYLPDHFFVLISKDGKDVMFFPGR